jgi:hypothetical protein
MSRSDFLVLEVAEVKQVGASPPLEIPAMLVSSRLEFRSNKTMAFDAALTLRERIAEKFEYSAIWYLEKEFDFYETLTREQDRNIKTFRTLEKSVGDIPLKLLRETAALERIHPALFNVFFTDALARVCDEFRPKTATEFIEALNAELKRGTRR